MKNRRLLTILIVIALILLIPLIAMQFTSEVNWDIVDFLVAGILLFCTGILCEFTLRTINKRMYRIVICSALFVVLVLIWIELAVGIFGTPLAGS